MKSSNIFLIKIRCTALQGLVSVHIRCVLKDCQRQILALDPRVLQKLYMTKLRSWKLVYRLPLWQWFGAYSQDQGVCRWFFEHPLRGYQALWIVLFGSCSINLVRLYLWKGKYPSTLRKGVHPKPTYRQACPHILSFTRFQEPCRMVFHKRSSISNWSKWQRIRSLWP